MSSELTDKAIESSKKAEELSSKPVLSASVFVENVTKLKNNYDQIDSYRREVESQAKAEKEVFEDARMKIKANKMTQPINAILMAELEFLYVFI